MSAAMDQYGYPEIEPYDTGLLPVGGEHTLYYEQVGNPNGYPIIHIHGGPGACSSPYHRRFFDPQKWRVILYDQRGCGKSVPFGSVDHNSTPYLKVDVIKLMEKLNVDQAVLFGGSWGSTLALATAVEFPDRFSALILRGIYLGNIDEMDYFYNKGEDGIGVYQPEYWQKFIDFVPPRFRGDPLRYYYEEIRNGNREAALQIAGYNWSEGMMYAGLTSSRSMVLEELYDDETLFAEALIAAHYFVNNSFLPDGHILRNIHQIAHKPVSITHGRYDMVCQPRSAWLLHEAWGSKSDLAFTLAGHASDDPENMKRLISETNRIYDLVKR